MPSSHAASDHVLRRAPEIPEVRRELALVLRHGTDERDCEGRPREMVGVSPDFGELPEMGPIADDDEGPVLPVLRARGPTAGIEDPIQVRGFDGALCELANDADGVDGGPGLHGLMFARARARELATLGRWAANRP